MTWLTRLFPNNNQRAGSGRRCPTKLGIERLEDRTVPTAVSVVPLTTAANNSTTFYTLQDAMNTAGANGVITIEPGAIADYNDDITQNNLTIQGDPTVPSSILPAYNISIDANNVTLKNVNINFVSVDPGFSGLMVTHSTLVSVFISGGPTGNGSNVITQNNITSDITVIGNTNLGAATNDQITNNTFSSFSDTIISVSSDNGALIQNNTINGGGAITTDQNGNSITRAPQTGIAIDGGTGVTVSNNNINLAGQDGTPTGATGVFTGIAVSPFDPTTAGLPAGTTVAAPNVQILNNTIQTSRGTGLAITAATTATGDRDTQVLVQGNDFHNNSIGVSYTGNGGSSITTDLGGGSLGSLGGNNFRGFTTKGNATSAAIVLSGVGSGAVLTAHSNMFVNPATASNVVFASSGSIDVSQPLTNNQAFVQTLYNDFLGRTGSIAELNHWVGILNASSTGQANVVNGILQSTEALDRVVEGYYLQYLGRAADAAGLSYWVGQIQGGASLETIQAGFIDSPEFISNNNSDYIQGLYRTFFGRTGSSAELAYWYAQLPSLGLAGVAEGFATSTENRQQFVTETYENYLHQTPTSSQVATWVGTSGSLASLEEQILSTTPFLNNG